MTINEKAFIISLIQEYTRIHKNIDTYESQLDKMERGLSIRDKSELDELNLKIQTEVERLGVFRNVEMEFWDEIEKKYGPGEFNPESLEYITQKQKKNGKKRTR